jgi:hypothetical protein
LTSGTDRSQNTSTLSGKSSFRSIAKTNN